MMFPLPPSRWEREHAGFVLRSLRFQAERDGDLPGTPAWGMFERRYDLAPARFESWHPNLAAMIRLSREADFPALPAAPPCVPAAPALPPAPPGPNPPQVAAPEPASLALGAIAAAAFLASRLAGRGRRRSVSK